MPRNGIAIGLPDRVGIVCLWAHNSGGWASHEKNLTKAHIRYWALPYRLGVAKLHKTGVRDAVLKGDLERAVSVIPKGHRLGRASGNERAQVLAMAKRCQMRAAEEAMAFADEVVGLMLATDRPLPQGSPEDFARSYDGPLPVVQAVREQYSLALPEAAAAVRRSKLHPHEDAPSMPPAPSGPVQGAATGRIAELEREIRQLKALNRALRQQVAMWMPIDDLELH